jgi:hypothetical protein
MQSHYRFHNKELLISQHVGLILSTHWRTMQMRQGTQLDRKDAIQFHQQNCAGLQQCSALEAMLSFLLYAVPQQN